MGPNPGCNQGTTVKDLVVVRFNFEMYNCLENNKQRTKRRFGVISFCNVQRTINYYSWWNYKTRQVSVSKHQSTKLDKDKSDLTLSINELDIANTELIKLLAVHIDENLNFTEHIIKLCVKASQKVGVLSRLRNWIPCKAKLLLLYWNYTLWQALC